MHKINLCKTTVLQQIFEMSVILLDTPLTTFSYRVTPAIGGTQIFVFTHLQIPLQWSFVMCLKSLGCWREAVCSWCSHRKIAWYVTAWSGVVWGVGGSQLYHAVRFTPGSGYEDVANSLQHTCTYLLQWISGPQGCNARRRKGSIQKHVLTGLDKAVL
jgi:hypothetical protein